jgi:hypothetical protein
MMKSLSVLRLLALLALSAPALAAPSKVNFQGRLTDSSSNPLTGSYSLTFRVFDVESGGAALWTEVQTVSADNGIFSVVLGSVTALTPSVFSGNDRWLELQVDANPPLTPRRTQRRRRGM